MFSLPRYSPQRLTFFLTVIRNVSMNDTNPSRSGWLSKRTVAVVLLISCLGSPAAAINVLYDFEGTDDPEVIDKYANDGLQNAGVFQNVFPDDTSDPIYGSQAAFFDLPEEPQGITVPPYSTLEVPDSTFGTDFSLTLAAHFRNDEDPLDFTRLFSSYRGTSAVSPERILLDFDRRDPGNINGLRAIVNNTVVQPESVPAAIDAINPGEYHHFAMTINAGTVKGYLNGTEILSGDVGLGYSNAMNIFLGEDPHDGGGSADEQFKGNIDEFLLIQRALPASDIAQLAAGNTVSSVVTPQPGERAVYYDFEGATAADLFTDDGAQDGILAEVTAIVSGAGEGKLGNGAVNFQDPRVNDPPPPPSPFSQLNLGPVGNLGDQFTLSAAINAFAGGQNSGGLARIFSTYNGGGSPAGRLILDVNPFAESGGLGTRLILPDGTVVATDTAPLDFVNETVTVTYDQGEVKIYLSGVEIASGTANTTGDVDLGEFDLRVGEDLGGSVNENFVGIMDDVLIRSDALTPEQVLLLHNSGASALPAPPLPDPDFADSDFDEDGNVDGVDLAAWETGFGLTGSATKADGDATGEGNVAGDDFMIWQRENGSSLNLNSSAANVPEPAAFALIGLAWAVWAGSSRSSASRR